MSYFFVSSQSIENNIITFSGPDVVHITRVLRLRPGDTLTVVDETGKRYRVRLSDVLGKVKGLIEDEFVVDVEPEIYITLVQGLPKGDKMKMIIQKSTELGVHEIIPLQAERSIAKLAGDKIERRSLRWQRVAMEAAKQCRRGKVPKVARPMSLGEALFLMTSGAVGIMPWEQERKFSLSQALKQIQSKKIFLFIGPEGGFNQREVDLARKSSVVTVTLGPRVLRTETAALAAMTIIMYELGDLGV